MTFREDVRTAFDHEQSALGDVGDAPHRLVHSAMVNRDQAANRGWQWAAGVAAVLIAAIVITTFALVKVAGRSSAVPAASPSPSAKVSPTPLVNELNVPDSTPIIVYLDPANHDQVDGITWDGKQTGKLTGAMVGPANPANSLFGGQLQIVDRHGRTAYTGYFGGKVFNGTFSDDGDHVCVISPAYVRGGTANGAPALLQLITLGGSTRTVATVGRISDQVANYVAACSPQTDRAVAVQSGGQGVGTAQYWVVQLSTGRVLWTHSFDLNQPPVQIVASRDGQYVAENLTGGSAGSTIYGADGNPLAALADWVDAFSWDGLLAVVDRGPGVGAARLINWRSDELVWTAPYHWALVGTLQEPSGGAMAVWAAPSPGLSAQAQLPNLYIVSALGSVITVITGAAKPSS